MGITNFNKVAVDTDGIIINGTAVTATAAELNAIAGGGLSAAELGILDGATLTTAELNQLDATSADGATLAWADVQLDADDVKALAATNIEIVPAPAAGLAAIPVAVFLYLDHAGTNDFVQTAGGDHLALRYAASAEIAEIGSEANVTALIEASADAALYDTIEGGFVPEAATAIVLDNNGANEYTGNAGGDNTLSVRVWYRVVPMAAFS